MIIPDTTTQAQDEKVSIPPLCPHYDSLWSLTLDEIELKSGRTLGAMTMEEFLSNVWCNADSTNQVLLAQPNPNDDDDRSSQQQQQPYDQQSSSISIPPSLCNKTVDEVWFHIQREIFSGPHHLNPSTTTTNNNNNDNDSEVLHHEEQQYSLGSMTLEDFLVQAGAVVEEAAQPEPSNSVTNVSGDGQPEVLVERKQRRMIKNRESAARSRARKQLEFELNFLKQDNTRLQQMVEIEQAAREKIMKMMKGAARQKKKADKLRSTERTTSI
ncbi:unnamed protein product [Linum trigynum]|uniref:BZIP domain-containing protein n=1 Tax=Linum trigynum TaxID=586398 RepID=A0AAV2G147_9ROSI